MPRLKLRFHFLVMAVLVIAISLLPSTVRAQSNPGALFIFFANPNCDHFGGVVGLTSDFDIRQAAGRNKPPKGDPQIAPFKLLRISDDKARSALIVTWENPRFFFIIFDTYPTKERDEWPGDWAEYFVQGNFIACIHNFETGWITHRTGSGALSQTDHHYHDGNRPSAIGIWDHCRWGYRCSTNP